MNVVELNNLQFRWKGQIQNTIDIGLLKVKQGEHVFIKGASGSGKTTLLNLLAGILVPGAGSISILEKDIGVLSLSARDRFRADHMGIIFQQFNLLPYLSVIENIVLPCDFSSRRKQQAGNVQETAKQLLEHLGLKNDLNDRSVMDLSVGQQQRVAVARALIGKPELIIADEPTSALDTESRNDFLKLLFSEAEQQGSTILFVSHDPYIAEKFPRVLDLHALNQASVKSPTKSETV